MKQGDPTKKALTAKQVSERYGIGAAVLANLRWQKRGPAYFRVGRKIIYRPEDIELWLFRHPVLTSDSVDG